VNYFGKATLLIIAKLSVTMADGKQKRTSAPKREGATLSILDKRSKGQVRTNLSKRRPI